MKFIDGTLEKKVFPYLKTKYPLTVENNVNKALQNSILQIDNSEIVANDYLFISEIEF